MLRDYVDEGIATSGFPIGSWLPSVRTLAAKLHVHRNTVSKVYQSLEREGLAKRVPGKGMLVVGTPGKSLSPAARLERTAEALLSQAKDADLDLDRLQQLLQRVDNRLRHGPRIRIALAECNQNAAATLAADLSGHLGMPVDPLLVDALQQPVGLGGIDILVTTFFHLHEVTAAAPPLTQVVGVSHETAYETILQIAQLGPRKRVVVVCPNVRTLERVEQTVRSYTTSEVVPIHTDGDIDLRGALAGADAAIVAWGTQDAVEQLRPDLPLITLRFHIDAQSVAHMRHVIEAAEASATATAPKISASRRHPKPVPRRRESRRAARVIGASTGAATQTAQLPSATDDDPGQRSGAAAQ